MIALLFFTGIAYLLGSVCSAIIVCQALKLPDPCQEGSKNPGASNVLRIGGKQAAAMTLAGDALKGFIPVFLAKLVGVSGFGLGIIGIGALLGHIFPLYFGFKGGKGVATGFGCILGISIIAGLLLAGVWFAVAKVSQYASLASLAAAAAAPILLIFTAGFGPFLPVCGMVGLLAWRHQDNIMRLRTGTENKLSL